MPVYDVEQYEVHAATYRVEAESPAHAIKKVFDGKAEMVDDSLDFIAVCDDMGLPVEEEPALVETLRSLGVAVSDHVHSIRSIAEVEEEGAGKKR